jgi:hypothetical protein
MDGLGNTNGALVAVGLVSVTDGVPTIAERQGQWTLAKADVGRYQVTMPSARHYTVSASAEGPSGSGGYPATMVDVAHISATLFEIDLYDATATAGVNTNGLINADGTIAIQNGTWTTDAHTPASGIYSISGLTGIDLTATHVPILCAAGHSEGGGTGGGIINFNVLSATSFGAIITTDAAAALDTAWSFSIQGPSAGGAVVPVDLGFSFRVYEVIPPR